MESRQRYTLTDVYNAAKYDRNFNYTFWTHITLDILAASAMKYAGYSLVVMASSLVAIISVLGFFVVLPNLFTPWGVSIVAHSIWGIFLVFSIYFNYFMAVFTKPGSPNDGLAGGNAECTPSMKTLQEDQEAQYSANYRVCKRCSNTKPQRTHHCSICNSCVLKMDHHCPWVSNCVGYRNYRYFVSFLFWVTLATLYVSGISGALLIRKGSLLFPTNGRSPTQILTETFFGSTDNNIYATIYEVLAGTNKSKNARKREHGHHQRSRDALQDAQRDPTAHTAFSAAATADTSETAGAADPSIEKRRALEEEYIKIPPVARAEHDSLVEGHEAAAQHGGERKKSNALLHSMGIPMVSRRKRKNDVTGPGSMSALSFLAMFGTPDLLVFIAFMLSCGVWIGTGSLLSFHIFLIRGGYTTIEFFESDIAVKQCKAAGIPYKHPYDRGFAANFAEVFGPGPWYLALLPSTRAPPVVIYGPELCVPVATMPTRTSGAGSSGLGAVATMGGEGSPTRRPQWENNTVSSAADSVTNRGTVASEHRQGGASAQHVDLIAQWDKTA